MVVSSFWPWAMIHSCPAADESTTNPERCPYAIAFPTGQKARHIARSRNGIVLAGQQVLMALPRPLSAAVWPRTGSKHGTARCCRRAKRIAAGAAQQLLPAGAQAADDALVQLQFP